MNNSRPVCIKNCTNPYICFDNNTVIIKGLSDGAQVHSVVHILKYHTLKVLTYELSAMFTQQNMKMNKKLKHKDAKLFVA
jgi:hypothetical protein